jgi:hypothetical protein
MLAHVAAGNVFARRSAPSSHCCRSVQHHATLLTQGSIQSSPLLDFLVSFAATQVVFAQTAASSAVDPNAAPGGPIVGNLTQIRLISCNSHSIINRIEHNNIPQSTCSSQVFFFP